QKLRRLLQRSGAMIGESLRVHSRSCALTERTRTAIRTRTKPRRDGPRILVPFDQRNKTKQMFLQTARLVFRRCVVYPAAALSTNDEAIVPIILAGGSSKHLDFPKPLARFGDKTALLLAVENCCEV